MRCSAGHRGSDPSSAGPHAQEPRQAEAERERTPRVGSIDETHLLPSAGTQTICPHSNNAEGTFVLTHGRWDGAAAAEGQLSPVHGTVDPADAGLSSGQTLSQSSDPGLSIR